jgi:hypothetical protein
MVNEGIVSRDMLRLSLLSYLEAEHQRQWYPDKQSEALCEREWEMLKVELARFVRDSVNKA